MDPIAQTLALSKQLSQDQLATWTDDKRRDFVNTFDARCRAARWILYSTAEQILTEAERRHFVSAKHTNPLRNNRTYNKTSLMDGYQGEGKFASYTSQYEVGGRSQVELETIAQERARVILDSLPQLNQAVRIISPEIAELIERRDELLKQGKKLMEESHEVSGPILMDEFPPDTTLAEFKKSVKEREEKRRSLLNKLDDVGREGESLSGRINKFLYSGLPGLSDAVVEVVKRHIEQATALGTMERRVSESVMFGDSEAALGMLKRFEEDEVTVSTEIKAQFDKALEVLKLAGSKQAKKLNKGK